MGMVVSLSLTICIDNLFITKINEWSLKEECSYIQNIEFFGNLKPCYLDITCLFKNP